LSDGKGVNESRRGGGALPGSLAGAFATYQRIDHRGLYAESLANVAERTNRASREVLRLDLLVRTIRETLQVARGQVLTDAVIEQRARNAAQAVDYAMAAFDDDETLPG
jgi:hypothetical protein